ncbi:MAG: TIGR02391 family protein [Deltaproteobacteria bacterium]|nr:TIGR02391 family protein [Deltaproteobacteria bacterium]
MSPQKASEPSDHHAYDWVIFYKDTFHFYLRSIQFYRSLLEKDIHEIENDTDLKELIEDKDKNSLQIYREHSRSKRVEDWLNKHIEKGGPDAFDYDVSISHGTVRYIKGAAILYLKHLKNRRNILSSKPNISKYVLETVDNQISSYEENLNIGVFENASPLSFLLDELIENEIEDKTGESQTKLAKVERPRPVVIDSIQIVDSELRERCLDLFDAFHKDGKHERLDTVIAEATRILETRLRTLTGSPQECIGVDLAKAAFAGEYPVLRVSDVNSEQEAVHLLFRGTFGFIRNPVQHKLLGKLSPDRVLQILGFIDHLLFVADTARRKKPIDD